MKLKSPYLIPLILFTAACQMGSKKKPESVLEQEFRPFSEKEHLEISPSLDTVFISHTKELEKNLKSNTVLIIEGGTYILETTLILKAFKNLSLKGLGLVEILLHSKNESVLKIENSKNILLENIDLGGFPKSESLEKNILVEIQNSSNINIQNCKIKGHSKIGLVTQNVSDLFVANSELTNCSILIFDLQNSQNIKFFQSKFCDNNLNASVLGGFTNGTRRVEFQNCEFSNNKPKMIGNPAFNFDGNWKDFHEKILFSNCTFRKNVGFKWYPDKIQLENCIIDSNDFKGLSKN